MIRAENTQLSFCGMRLDALKGEDLIEQIECARSEKKKLLILNHNLHSLFLYQTDSEFRDAYKNASCVYIDGIPVIWLARAAGLPVNKEHRITFLDSFESILRISSERKWRVFYLGSTEDTLQDGLRQLRQAHPDLILAGRNGYLGPSFEEASAAVAEINAFRPDLLFVGMGMPNQERFLSQYFADLTVTAALTSGATLDYVTGRAYKPPAWAGPLGLYGLLRLASDPKRLWRRYLWEPIVLFRYIGFKVIEQRRAMKSASRA